MKEENYNRFMTEDGDTQTKDFTIGNPPPPPTKQNKLKCIDMIYNSQQKIERKDFTISNPPKPPQQPQKSPSKQTITGIDMCFSKLY